MNGEGVTRDWADSKRYAIEDYEQFIQRSSTINGCVKPLNAIGAAERLFYIPDYLKQEVNDTLHIGGNFVQATNGSFEGWLTGELTVYFRQDSPSADWVHIQKKYGLLNGNFGHDGKHSFLIARTGIYKAIDILELTKQLFQEPAVESVINQVASRAFAPQPE